MVLMKREVGRSDREKVGRSDREKTTGCQKQTFNDTSLLVLHQGTRNGGI